MVLKPKSLLGFMAAEIALAHEAGAAPQHCDIAATCSSSVT